MNSIAIAASRMPIRRIAMLMPVVPRKPAMYSAECSASQMMNATAMPLAMMIR